MTHSSGKPHPTGDRGQRYEVTYLEDGGERKVYGWTDDLLVTEHMCRMIGLHPERRDPKVRDRHGFPEGVFDPVAAMLSL